MKSSFIYCDKESGIDFTVDIDYTEIKNLLYGDDVDGNRGIRVSYAEDVEVERIHLPENEALSWINKVSDRLFNRIHKAAIEHANNEVNS